MNGAIAKARFANLAEMDFEAPLTSLVWLTSIVSIVATYVVSYLIIGLSWVSRLFDEQVINPGFDQGCKGVTKGGGLMSRLQDGRVQHYLRVIGVALTVLALLVIWGCRLS